MSASITGTDAYAASLGELNRLDKKCKCLSALSKGRAYDSTAIESHGRSWTNAQLFDKWKVLLARSGIAIRRIKWWQAMTEHNRAHWQTMARFGDSLQARHTTLTDEGSFEPMYGGFL